jgi:hypothetical protein
MRWLLSDRLIVLMVGAKLPGFVFNKGKPSFEIFRELRREFYCCFRSGLSFGS